MHDVSPPILQRRAVGPSFGRGAAESCWLPEGDAVQLDPGMWRIRNVALDTLLAGSQGRGVLRSASRPAVHAYAVS